MGRLVSVNVGMPKNVQWRDKTVYTGIWKTPVEGPVMVRRLNIDGDGQGDLGRPRWRTTRRHGVPDGVVRLLEDLPESRRPARPVTSVKTSPSPDSPMTKSASVTATASVTPNSRSPSRASPAFGSACASTSRKCPICLSRSIVRASTSGSSPRDRSGPVTTSCGPAVAVTNSASPTSTRCCICRTATSNNSARSSTFPR